VPERVELRGEPIDLFNYNRISRYQEYREDQADCQGKRDFNLFPWSWMKGVFPASNYKNVVLTDILC